jgi:DNA-binding CsgD family transcriptional regulator
LLALGDRLLEREREVATLAAVVDEVAAGRARVVLVEGPAGIGKTRLLAEARRRAGDTGLVTLAARGGELERDFPFGVVRQLFEPILVDDEVRARSLAGAAGTAWAVFEPISEGEDGDRPEDPSFASLHGLYWLTVNLSAGGPLLLVVDDLHWCDRASLRFLAYLARRIEGLPVMLVCSLRPAERGADAALIGEVAADPATVSIRPRPLSEPAVADLVGELLGETADSAFSSACRAATGGNPLLLHELMRALDSEGVRPDAGHVDAVSELGPRAAGRSVLVRLARLPPHAVEMARAAAVLGDGADFSAVAAIAGLDEREAAEAAAALLRAEILRDEPSVGFVHPLVAAAVYHDITPVERGLRHERAARLLAPTDAPVERIALHLLAMPPRGDAWVVECLTEAAAAALHKGAADSAVAYLERALAEPPPPELRSQLLLDIGRAEALVNGPAAARHLREGYEALEDPVARATAAQLLARTLLFTGAPAEAAEVARRVAAELPPERGDLRDALEAFELMATYFGAGDLAALRRLERHRARPVGPGRGAKMLAAVATQEWVYAGGPSDECTALALEALAGGDLIAADNALLGVTAITQLAMADREEAMDAWQVSLADAYARGSLFSKTAISLWYGFTLYRRGELAEAEASLRTALEELASWGFGQEEATIYCHAFLCQVLLERGDLAAAREVLEQSSDPGGRDDGARYWLGAQLELLVAEGSFERAVAVGEDFARRFSHIRNPVDAPWRSHTARALDALGRTDEALSLLAKELEVAREWGAPGTLARTLRILGTLERDGGLGTLAEAAEVVAGSPAKLEHAKALAALGAGLRRARRPADAREPLRQAVEIAEVCGARGLAEQAGSELHAAGGRPRRTALTGVESLTASERRVASLAAAGSSNRDIAQALFVTPKTVELHLSNAYRKLGIRSRRELPAELAA